MDVQVKYGDDPTGYAHRLLRAARKLEKSTSVVQFSPDGHYVVPEEVADEAGVSFDVLDDGGREPAKAPEKPQEPAGGDGGDGGTSVDPEPDNQPHDPPGPRSEVEDTKAEAVPDPEPEANAEGEVEAPKKNLSRDVWADFAKSQGAPDEETKPQDEGGLSRADLIKKYAPKE